jgi:hypothetical protein
MRNPDVRVSNLGTIFLFTPLTEEGKAWMDENVEDDAHQYFGPSLVVEHRFARDLADGMVNDGLQVA